MYFKKETPSDLLKKYIKCYWVAKEDGYKIVREINLSTNVCVQFHIGHEASYKLITKDFLEGKKQSVGFILKKIESSPLTAQYSIIGPHRTLMLETADHHTNSFCIEFKTGIRKRFFGKENTSIANIIIPLDGTNTLLSNLAEIISKCNTEKIFEIVDNCLIENYLPIISHREANEQILEIIGNVTTNPPDAKVEMMASRLNMSQRNIERLFKQYTGLTPKQFIVIQRINRVLENMKVHQENSLMEILEMSGYYDQTHLNKDFQYIGGLPATQIFQNFIQYLVNSPDALCLNYEPNSICGFNTLT